MLAASNTMVKHTALNERSRAGVFDVHEGDSRNTGPIVVLFGFMGSTPRVVAKYASAYLVGTTAARRVYSTTSRAVDVFINPRGLRMLARSTLTLLAASHAGEPIVFAYMSNGGCTVHPHLIELLPAFPSVKVAGTVFDSAPTWLSWDSMARAPTEAIRNPLVRSMAYVVLRLMLPPALLAVWGPGFAARFWAAFEADPLPCRALYIYSIHDELTAYDKLDELVERRRAQHSLGASGIRTLRIGDGDVPSPHVAHLLKHPERYREAIARLLSDAVM